MCPYPCVLRVAPVHHRGRVLDEGSQTPLRPSAVPVCANLVSGCGSLVHPAPHGLILHNRCWIGEAAGSGSWAGGGGGRGFVLDVAENGADGEDGKYLVIALLRA